MGTQHATYIVRMLGPHNIDDVGAVRHEEVVEAVLGEGHTDETRVRAIIGHDCLELTVERESHLSDAVAALIIANTSRAHELLPHICNELDLHLKAFAWRSIPAITVGFLHAATWCEANSKSYSANFSCELPIRLGMLLREYIQFAPEKAQSDQDYCSQWVVGRFSQLLAQYTSCKAPAENMRRIAFLVGKISESSRAAPECTENFLRQVSHRALQFMNASCGIRALHSVLNADRVIPNL